MLPGRGVSRHGGRARSWLRATAKLLAEQGVALRDASQTDGARNISAGDAPSSTCAVDGRLRGLSSPFPTRCAAESARHDRRHVRDGLGVSRCCSPAITKTPPQPSPGSLGIGEVRANCLPEDKLDYIDAVVRKIGSQVCMIGDGVNDAPALKKRPCGHRHGRRGQRHRS